MNRRDFLVRTAGMGLAIAGPVRHAHAYALPDRLQFGLPTPFNFDALCTRAKTMAASPYRKETAPAADLVHTIDFDLIQKIKFRPEFSLWPDSSYPVRFFHLHRWVPLPVKINIVSGGTAREILYSAHYFDDSGSDIDRKLPPNLGFGGFRVMDGPGEQTDWLAFQGASYFRSCGDENQYGASARGIAIDTATQKPEEFPRFTEFWLAEPQNAQAITIYALLNGPSITGAYHIEATREGGVLTAVNAQLFARRDIERLGAAPLTSMFWYGENDDRRKLDWRPEVHDSDGLALWTGKGERIWRPLINPRSVLTNSFVDTNPKGFGLLQRDRNFDHYQDDGAFYNRRPSLWVETVGNWGDGAVQLVEIPTDDEIHDNIVAYWTPAKPVRHGDALSFSYKLFWQSAEPQFPKDIAKVIATRLGRGGIPGQPRPKDSYKFVIDFQGGPLAQMAPRYDVKPVATVSRGTIKNPYVVKIVGTDNWRAVFDVYLDGSEPVDMRCYLRLGETTLSETWLYQFFPPVAA